MRYVVLCCVTWVNNCATTHASSHSHTATHLQDTQTRHRLCSSTPRDKGGHLGPRCQQDKRTRLHTQRCSWGWPAWLRCRSGLRGTARVRRRRSTNPVGTAPGPRVWSSGQAARVWGARCPGGSSGTGRGTRAASAFASRCGSSTRLRTRRCRWRRTCERSTRSDRRGRGAAVPVRVVGVGHDHTAHTCSVIQKHNTHHVATTTSESPPITLPPEPRGYPKRTGMHTHDTNLHPPAPEKNSS